MLPPAIAPVVNIQVARTCNLKCTFCSHEIWADPKGLMDYALFERVMASLKADGCRTVCFVSAQGESLLHPRIFDMLALALRSGFETNLVTNGTPLTTRRIAQLAQLGLDAIQFSFAGWDRASYETAYVGGKFDRVSNSLRGLIAHLRGTRTTLSINGVLANSEQYELTKQFLLGLGAQERQIRLQLAHNWGGTVANGWVRGDRPIKPCPLLASTPGIYIDGRVTACGCIDANGALEIGRITERPLSELRRGDRYLSLVRAFEEKAAERLPPLCAQCEIPYL